VLTATYLINKLSSAILSFKSPLNILYERKISLVHLRVFGCTSFVHKNRIDKLDFTSIKIFFLGYSTQKKGYKCYDPKEKKLYISRHVIFFENESFKNLEENQSEQLNSSDFVLPCITNEGRIKVFVENVTNETDEEERVNEEAEEPTEVQGPEAEQNLRRSTRQTWASTRLKDFATYTVQYPIQDYISYKNISEEH
jgi:hypothetical protein